MPLRILRRPRTPGAPAHGEGPLSAASLLATVRELAFPRPCSDAEANARAARIVSRRLEEDGRAVVVDGVHGNLLALPPAERDGDAPLTIVSAHFDSVAGTPGADDNASAVAAMLAVSRALAQSASPRRGRVGFIAWNAEEDGILGSADFARRWRANGGRPRIDEVHVLEMLGFASHAPGSQTYPPGILSKLGLPTTADFVGVLGNHQARPIVKRIVGEARRETRVDVVALQTYFGVEQRLPSLDLSDHVRLWAEGIPAVLWTDTAFYRNPHYHMPSDTPDTLDADFMSAVAALLYRVIAR